MKVPHKLIYAWPLDYILPLNKHHCSILHWYVSWSIQTNQNNLWPFDRLINIPCFKTLSGSYIRIYLCEYYINLTNRYKLILDFDAFLNRIIFMNKNIIKSLNGYFYQHKNIFIFTEKGNSYF